MQDADIHTMCLVNGYRDSDYVQIHVRCGARAALVGRAAICMRTFPRTAQRRLHRTGEATRHVQRPPNCSRWVRYASDEALLSEAKAQVGCRSKRSTCNILRVRRDSPKGCMLTQPQYPEQRAHDRRLHALHANRDKAADLRAACSTASAACWASARSSRMARPW